MGSCLDRMMDTDVDGGDVGVAADELGKAVVASEGG